MRGESFRVDLRGIVDILSHHLYSSPRVYLRELIQNARDAIVTGRAAGYAAQDTITIAVESTTGTVTVSDQGIGLTEEEMRSVLATIGASSKRGDFLTARSDLLGQFGIGLLSCFLVADHIEVRSRSARAFDAPTLVWRGSSDGTFTVDRADAPLPTPGTQVRLQARPDDREWVTPDRVRLLATRFAGLLDLPVVFAGHGATETLTDRRAPWEGTSEEAARWCEEELGFAPIASLPIRVDAAGVRGVAFITNSAGRVGNRRGDSVFSRGMFVADDNTQLAPKWAYFARLAVDAGDLSLTASRESFQDTAVLDQVRAEIGVQIRDGIERFAESDPRGFSRFLTVHSNGLLAMAVSDNAMLDLVVARVPWETNEGPHTLRQAVQNWDSVVYTTSETEFAAFAPIVRGQRTLLLNGSYVYGVEILRHVSERRRGSVRLRPFDARAFLADLPTPAPDDLVADQIRRWAAPVVESLGLVADFRAFSPLEVPVI